MVPPPLLEYTRAPLYFGLLIKRIRRDPLLAMQVADVMNDKTNLPISRAEIKRQKQVGNAAARVQIPIVPTCIVPTATTRAAASDSSSAGGICRVEIVPSGQQKQLLWAKVTASKQGTEGKHKHCQEDCQDGGIGTGRNDPFGKDEGSDWTLV